MSNWNRILEEDERLKQNKRRLKFLAFRKETFPGADCNDCGGFTRYTATNKCVHCGSQKMRAHAPKLDKITPLSYFGRKGNL